jgi:hypothetical protein
MIVPKITAEQVEAILKTLPTKKGEKRTFVNPRSHASHFRPPTNGMTQKTASAWLGIILTLLFVLCVAVQFAHCTEPATEYINPNTYILGSLSQGSADSTRTIVQIRPYNTPLVYTNNLVFCGDVAYMFRGKTGALLIVYRSVAHRLVEDLACHDLVAVFEVKP